MVTITISCGNKDECVKNCCQTLACKTQCIKNKCCKADKTCDVNGHQDCKHKCCDTKKETCHLKADKPCCLKKE